MEKSSVTGISKIAIIGTEGAGKTVFVTVWSKLLEKQEEGKPFIVPDPSTYVYIEKNWSKLRNAQWPESTPQAEFIHLFWRLKMPSGHLCPINVCDVAGHDIRRLFTGNKPQASDDPTTAIYDTVAAANIVLVIINLKDFITTTESQRIDNCANLLSMLQFMFEQKKKVALVFSQWHEYETWVAEHGSVEAVLSSYMPSIYNTCCLEEETNYFKVASVVETTPSVEAGKTITNPAPNFSTSGFPSLNDWIMAVVAGKTSTLCNPQFLKKLTHPNSDATALGVSENKDCITTSDAGKTTDHPFMTDCLGRVIGAIIIVIVIAILKTVGCLPADFWTKSRSELRSSNYNTLHKPYENIVK